MITISNQSKREIVENILLDKFREIRPYLPEMSGVVDRYKDGSFGVSNLAFALYSNGRNPRGESPERPYGLVFEDGETLFSLGYFRKELDPEDADGYLFVVAPRGKSIGRKIVDIAKAVRNARAPCKGTYARFLEPEQYAELLGSGFLPAEASPWHPAAPMEDETHSHAIVDMHEPARRGSKSGSAGNRFSNFLKRNGLRYSLEMLSPGNTAEAKHVIDSHFRMLRKAGKAIGSTPEDHYNMLDQDLLSIDGVHGYIGYLQGNPVSVFVGEFLSPGRYGLYTPFTLREFDMAGDATGFTAMPAYAYNRLFEMLRKEQISEVHLGGSEFASLDAFKMRMGAREDRTHWAFMPFGSR